MIYKIVSIKDRAIEAFGRPIFVLTLGQAIRSFQDEINNPQSEMHKHPEDYDLWELGEYNDATGMMNNHEQRQIAIGKQLKLNGELK